MGKNKLIALLMLLFAALIWGVGFSVQSIGAETLGTYTLICMKTLGGFLLIPITFLFKQKFTKQAIIGGMLSGFVFFFANVFQQKGIEVSSVGKASFLSTLYIVFTPILSIFFKRKPNLFQVIGVAIALTGMYFLCIEDEFIIEIGDSYLIICAIFMAFQIIVIDKMAVGSNSLAFASIQGITVCILSGIVALFKETITIESITASIPVILYLMIGSSAIGEALQVKYQNVLGPTLSSLAMSFESVFGAIGGAVILLQKLSNREIFGCVLIFIAVIIAQIEKKDKKSLNIKEN